MIFGFGRKRRRAEADAARAREAEDAADREEAQRREVRRHAAEKRVLDNLRSARENRAAQDSAEAAACETIALTRRDTDTAVRRVQQKHSEISGVLRPKNGKSVQELALEALADEEAGRTG